MPRRKNHKHNGQGHYCWSCDRHRANEQFSGRGHARHICRDCRKLGPEELAYRQALRDLARCLSWEGTIPRKRRKAFARFLEHDNPRIRSCAERILAEDLLVQAHSRADAGLDDALLEDHLEPVSDHSESIDS